MLGMLNCYGIRGIALGVMAAGALKVGIVRVYGGPG